MLRGAELPGFTGWSWMNPADHYGSRQVPDWPEMRALSISDFHFRTRYPFPTLRGDGSGAEGLVARKKVGTGVLLATAMDPTWIRTDQQPFMRLTAWRHSRAIVQMICGLGGTMELDEQIFNLASLPTGELPLAGSWEAIQVQSLSPSPSPDQGHEDPGISAKAQSLVENPDADAPWKTYSIPGAIESVDAAWKDTDGEFVVRKRIEISEEWAGKDLLLELDGVDDHDETYWNGQKIGSLGADHPSPYNAKRLYAVPGEQVQVGENVLSIRIWDKFGNGGMLGIPEEYRLSIKGGRKLKWYHPDYRRDFAYGDDPYRYYRW
jgi:hypothetical protein